MYRPHATVGKLISPPSGALAAQLMYVLGHPTSCTEIALNTTQSTHPDIGAPEAERRGASRDLHPNGCLIEAPWTVHGRHSASLELKKAVSRARDAAGATCVP
jgi:hypothetical protein